MTFNSRKGNTENAQLPGTYIYLMVKFEVTAFALTQNRVSDQLNIIIFMVLISSHDL